MVANSSLRPGNSHTADNALTFLDDNLDKPAGKQVLLFVASGADNSLSNSAFLDDLDRRDMHYLVALRLNHPL